MEKVKVGFLGCGYMGQNAHLANYTQLDSCEVIAVCDVKAKQCEKVAKRYGIRRVYNDVEAFLADPEIEAVIAAQYFESHLALVPKVLAAGKHILTEKPLCVFPQNGHVLVEAAKNAGKIHMVAYHKRSDLAVEYTRDQIAAWKSSGELGKMTYVRITMPPGDWVGGADRPIITDETYGANIPEASPEGINLATRQRMLTFVNYYIHQVNLLRFLMDEDYQLTFADRAGYLMVVESVSGITGTIEMEPYSTTDDWQEVVLVCFEKGWIKVELPAPLAAQQAGRVTIFDNSSKLGLYTMPVLPNVSAMRNQAANFILAVQGKQKAPCLSSEAVKDLEIAAAYVNYMENINKPISASN